MLEINTRIEKGNVQKTNTPNRAATQADLDRIIESYDNAVYGPTAEPVLMEEERKQYSAEEEWQRLREIESNGGRPAVNLEGRNIPAEIIESILNNPLDMKPIEDTRMTALQEKIMGGKGIKAAVDVMRKVDKQEAENRAKLNEQITPRQTTTSATVDYSLIKMMIESALDEKLGEIKNALNEGVSRGQAYAPSMKYLSFKDNFYFVDNDDNVFECVMTYKGKNKKKK